MKFNAGDIITTSKPIVYAVNERNKGKICDRCLKKCEALKRCSKCRVMYYCAFDCQREDWREFHKHECFILQQFESTEIKISTAFYNLIRFCIKYHYAGNKIAGTWSIYDGTQRSLADLTSRLYVPCESILEAISNVLNNCGVKVEKNQVIYRFGQLLVNSLAISNDMYLLTKEDPYIGGGLYVEASVFDHACRPNAICVFEGPLMTVRALTEIDTDKDKVNISYLEGTLMMPRDVRQYNLKLFGYFDCECVLCADKDYDDEERAEFMALLSQLHAKMYVRNMDSLESTVVRLFTLIDNNLGTWNKTYVEVMVMLLQYKCDGVLMHNEKIQVPHDMNLLNNFQLALQKTHGTQHPLYKVSLRFEEIFSANTA